MPPLKLCMVASEVAPFAKTGGLADVTAALARTLSARGHDLRVILPLYRELRVDRPRLWRVEGLQDLSARFGRVEHRYSIRCVRLPGSEQDVYLVDCPELYDRAGFYTSDPDEPLRFALLSRAALDVCQREQWAPDVFHCNDWHTALLPLYLGTTYAWDALFEHSATLLTIHNIGYQGVFPADTLADLGLEDSRRLLHQESLREGRFGFLETGILHADMVSTVSPTYAREIQGAELGAGLDGLLRARREGLVGILNGVDYDEWSPESDARIPHRFSAADLSGKARDKAALLSRMDVSADPDLPVVGIVSRLTAQKGFSLLPDVLPVFLQRGALKLCVLGSGDERHERYFQWLRETFPHAVGWHCGYDEDLAHLIEAGSDLFLMPSRYEPCGLNQMYSLRYGTIPIVRRTGGLADTVEPFEPGSDGQPARGTGFVFDEYSSEALFQTLERALAVRAQPGVWAGLVQEAMARDFSWERQGERYVELYGRLVDEIRSRARSG